MTDVGDRLAQPGLGGLAHPAEHHRRDLGRRVDPAAGHDVGVAVGRGDDLVRAGRELARDLGVVELAAHQALDRVDRALGVGHRLAARHLPDQPLARGGEADHRRGRARAVGVGDHDGGVAVHHGDARVGRAQIDSDDAAHGAEAAERRPPTDVRP
jgi:hypothetical protein